MDARAYLSNYSKQANTFLNSYFKIKKNAAKKIDSDLSDVIEVFQNYSKGGKNLRGALTILGYKAAGGKNLKAIMPVSCGIELFHNFILIHDDIIDKDKLRRGMPTVHEIYSKGKDAHYGNSKAIMVGDIGAFLAYELILSSSFSKEKVIAAVGKLNDLLTKTAYGQILDIDYDYKKEVTWDEILKVRTYKTSYYTIVLPLTVGATLASANKKTLKAIEDYGVPVGISFQLIDDILGIFGKSGKTGKSTEGDIKEGKKTLLFAKALELANKKDKEYLLKWYGNKDLDKEKIEKVKEVIKMSGSLDYSKDLAKKLIVKGKKNISQITKSKKEVLMLESLADFIIEREK